ncbi:MAG: hypothetical protein ACKVX9_02820, partial [Blastocatellia bacterium]
LSIPAVTLRFTAGYRLVFLRNTTMRRLSINIAKLCPTFNHTPQSIYLFIFALIDSLKDDGETRERRAPARPAGC